MESKMSDDTMADPWSINTWNSGFWDPHMVVSMLKWLQTRSDYDETTVVAAMKEVYNKTLLLDDYSRVVGETAPDEMVQYASKMKEEFVFIESKLAGFLSCMISIGRERQDSEGGGAMDRKTIHEWEVYMRNRHNQVQDDLLKVETEHNRESPCNGFPENALELLLRYCYLFYASGEYNLSKRWLVFYLDHVCEFTVEGRERTDLRVKCLWGLVAASLMSLPSVDTGTLPLESGTYNASEVENSTMLNSYDDATDTAYIIPRSILIIDDYLEPTKNNRKVVITERIWLIYWSIWGLTRYYFHKVLASPPPSGTSTSRSTIPFHIEWTRLIDWLFSEQTLSIIATFCPQLLRYVAIITILNRQRQDHFKATVDIISRISPQFSDPFTSIIQSLFLNFDFEEAQQKLTLCEKAAATDFLLYRLENLIEEHSRLLIFQTYCRIQKSINIDTIAEKLHMTADTAERWIVNLIRSARLEAKIDSERNRVEIASVVVNPYQEVLDKTRNLVVRSSVLLQNMDKPGALASVSTVIRNDFANFRRPTTRSNNATTSDYRNTLRDADAPGFAPRKSIMG